jgi:hypothetical protein
MNSLLGAFIASNNARRNNHNGYSNANNNAKYGLSEKEIDDIIKESKVFGKKLILYILLFIGIVTYICLTCK